MSEEGLNLAYSLVQSSLRKNLICLRNYRYANVISFQAYGSFGKITGTNKILIKKLREKYHSVNIRFNIRG